VRKLVKDYFPKSNDSVIVLIDADYSPLKGGSWVSLHVEQDKIQRKEKLVLNIQSKGWITPLNALREAIKIINSLFSIITEQIEKNDNQRSKIKTKSPTKKTGKLETES
jgi:DNA-directed RNA polymerase alpha subunit